MAAAAAFVRKHLIRTKSRSGHAGCSGTHTWGIRDACPRTHARINTRSRAHAHRTQHTRRTFRSHHHSTTRSRARACVRRRPHSRAEFCCRQLILHLNGTPVHCETLPLVSGNSTAAFELDGALCGDVVVDRPLTSGWHADARRCTPMLESSSRAQTRTRAHARVLHVWASLALLVDAGLALTGVGPAGALWSTERGRARVRPEL